MARTNDQLAAEKAQLEQRARVEKAQALKQQLQTQMQVNSRRQRDVNFTQGMNDRERALNKAELEEMYR